MKLSNSKAIKAHKSKRLKIDGKGLESENEGSSSSNGRGNVVPSFDFEKHRASFFLKQGEIWAIRDEFGMPRRYALVEKDGDIHSAKVELLTNYDFYGRCTRDGVRRALGRFQGAMSEPLDSPAFSHKVLKWKRFYVLPRKGEVWAIRANNAKTFFGHCTPTLLKYQMVEVLTNYVEHKGMKIVYLVSITGVNGSCFRRYQSAFHVEPNYVLQRFSHQVPSIKVSGKKSMDDFLELDPSSLPLYVDDFETSAEPEINDNYLFLGLLDRRAYDHSQNDYNIWVAYDHECQVPRKYVELRSLSRYHPEPIIHELFPILADNNEKKWREAGLPIACGKFTLAPVETKKHFILFDQCLTWNMECRNTRGVYHFEIYPMEGEVWGIYKEINLEIVCNPVGVLDYHIVAIIGTTEKDLKVAHLIRVEGFKGLFKKKSELASEVEFLIPVHEFYRFSHKIPSHRFDENCSKEFLRGAYVLDPFLVPQKYGEFYSLNDPFLLERSKVRPSWLAIQYFVNKQKNSINLASRENSCNKLVEQEEIVVEDSQEGERNVGEIHASERMKCETAKHDTIHLIKFHEFDDTKSERNLNSGEVWAFFNGLNGLPLSYARIDKFLDPGLTVEVTLLQPHPLADEEMQWVEASLPVACGTFRASQSTCIEKKLLSHRVKSADQQPSKLFFRVYPRKGEVWAIYEHWNINWTYSDMSNNIQYKLVEVVSDFTQEAGVTVAALIREEGHENVFKRNLHEGFWLFMAFKGNELLRFSHCIPSVKMLGGQDGCTSEGMFRVKFTHKGTYANKFQGEQ